MSKGAVTVLMGGPDAEREVSLKSGHAVASALTLAGWSVDSQIIDRVCVQDLREMGGEVFFPVMHGPWGEGGPLQSLLEADGRPFVGAGARAAEHCMNKVACKETAVRIAAPTPEWELVHQGERCSLPAPVIVKPNDDGSSVALSMCRTDGERDSAVAELTSSRGAALVERWIHGQELTVGIVDEEAMPIIEIQAAEGTYDYEAKYLRNDTSYRVNPALPEETVEAMTMYALNICSEIGVRHLARVDFLLDEKGPWLLEVNTMPGFTEHSLLPMAAAEAGMPMTALCDRLVRLAVETSSQ